MLKIERTSKPDYNGFKITRVAHTDNRYNRNTGNWEPRTSVYFTAHRADGSYVGSNRLLKVLKRHLNARVAS